MSYNCHESMHNFFIYVELCLYLVMIELQCRHCILNTSEGTHLQSMLNIILNNFFALLQTYLAYNFPRILKYFWQCDKYTMTKLSIYSHISICFKLTFILLFSPISITTKAQAYQNNFRKTGHTKIRINQYLLQITPKSHSIYQKFGKHTSYITHHFVYYFSGQLIIFCVRHDVQKWMFDCPLQLMSTTVMQKCCRKPKIIPFTSFVYFSIW